MAIQSHYILYLKTKDLTILKNFWVVAYNAEKQPVWAKRGEKTPTPKWESNLPTSFEIFTKEDNASIVAFLSQDNAKENEKLQQRIKGIEKQLRDYKGDQVPKVMVMDDNKKRETQSEGGLIKGRYRPCEKETNSAKANIGCPQKD